MNYKEMMEEALRGVIRSALARTAEHGLTGDHHFYITFATDHPEVVLPDYLRARFPDEMTIVLQHQFWGLDVGDEGFSVTLSFANVQERLMIPFAAVTAFADPSVQFGLQFRAGAEERAGEVSAPTGPGKELVPQPENQAEDEAEDDGAAGNVVALDAFRKK